MKSGGFLRRTTELKRTTPLRSSAALGREGMKSMTARKHAPPPDFPPPRTKKKAKRRREKTTAEWELEKIAREAWHLAVVRFPCLMCRHFPVSAQIREAHGPDLRVREGHHVLAKRHLKSHGHAGLLWDRRNGLCLCRYHHARHENAAQRVPLDLVPMLARRFAHELGLDWILEREYAP